VGGESLLGILEVRMLKLLFALPAALFFALLPQEPATTPAPATPASPATLTNPVTPTSESQAHAKMVYGMDCAICHGEKGNGKGDLVGDMHLTIKDFNDPSGIKAKSDGDLFKIIKNGDDQAKMPAEGPRAKDQDIWNLVIYIRSLSK
jgi:mono/diheme cytochrome c family protein